MSGYPTDVVISMFLSLDTNLRLPSFTGTKNKDYFLKIPFPTNKSVEDEL